MYISQVKFQLVKSSKDSFVQEQIALVLIVSQKIK